MRKRRSRIGGRAHGLLVIAAITVMPWFGCQRDTKQVSTIPYQVVEEWGEPGQLFGRTIVIDSTYVNQSQLRRLGAQLRREAANDRFAQVYVFDDLAAAKSRLAAFAAITDEEWRKFKRLPQHVSPTERNLVANFQKHRVGEYSQNANTGNYEFYMFPEGYDGRMITVKY